MSSNAPISEMWKFYFGNVVFCRDGHGGTLTHVLFDAPSKRLTHLVVKQGRFWSKTVCAPFASVESATGDGIWLTSTLSQLAATPVDAGVSLDAHTVVKSDGGSGTLGLVAVQPGSGELAYIVARNLLAGRDLLLRAPYVATLASGQIMLAADPAFLKSLPPYRSDRELQREVDQIIGDLGFLNIDLKGMRLRVLDSVLFMDGNISSTLRGELARDQVEGVQGLSEVKNKLIGDDTLAAAIAYTLGQDERTRGLPIGVYPQLGVVRLSGAVRNAQQKTAAGEIARKFAGVRGVTNDLLLDPGAEMLYVMSAPEGGETKDVAPGKFTRHTQ